MEKIKLDLTDRKILSELDKNCRTPNSVLARKVKKSREAVKYRIQQLEKKGIISKFITSVNPNKLGCYMFKIYLKLENIPEARENFFNELKKNKSIYWIGISDGAFDCVFASVAKSIPEFYIQINELLSEWKTLIISKVIGTMVDTKQYNKKFFLNETDGSSVTFGGDIVTNIVDALDYEILDVLANDARIPLAKLSRKLNSTIEIIRTRIKKLEEKGIILSYRVAVDFNKLDLEFFKVFIYLRTLSKKDELALAEWTRTHPKFLYYIRSLAPWDIEPELVVENYKEFNKIINELREKFPNVIRNCEHLIMIDEVWMPAFEYDFFK
jgi:DNA-binding Lrp family transcriptional regulator